jgi:hypothetical protein
MIEATEASSSTSGCEASRISMLDSTLPMIVLLYTARRRAQNQGVQLRTRYTMDEKVSGLTIGAIT